MFRLQAVWSKDPVLPLSCPLLGWCHAAGRPAILWVPACRINVISEGSGAVLRKAYPLLWLPKRHCMCIFIYVCACGVKMTKNAFAFFCSIFIYLREAGIWITESAQTFESLVLVNRPTCRGGQLSRHCILLCDTRLSFGTLPFVLSHVQWVISLSTGGKEVLGHSSGSCCPPPHKGGSPAALSHQRLSGYCFSTSVPSLWHIYLLSS